uniref:protein transport protein Sec16B isoform X2 n=1 Tax=Doryrhamphus excisus TaxID=161450 RepID=UPI0025ADB1A7|nr:protein transport protein Sec16B isoform X2 [Doryrhamphus excisus]
MWKSWINFDLFCISESCGLTMDRKVRPRSQSDRHPHRDHRFRYEQGPPGPEYRVTDRLWPGPADHHYWTRHCSGAPAAFQNLDNSLQYSSAPPEQRCHLSRRGYDYQAYAQYDYDAQYAYYNYYSADQHTSWWPQDSWGAERHHDGTSSSYACSYSNIASCDPGDQEVRPSKYTKDSLEASRASGLSSSSYELSQYINGGEQCKPVTDSGLSPPAVPFKFSGPHVVVSFGPSGQLVKVTPGRSARGCLCQVEMHSLEVILSETHEQQEMRNFPGPLTREDLHKVDVIDFAHQKTLACSNDDGSSAALLWKILILLCRQNGQIVGSDVAELLMQGSLSDGSIVSDDTTLIDFSEDNVAEAPPSLGDDLLTGSCSAEMSKKSLQSYTQLLLAGRKKEALESAMSGDLWGHALFLASKMDMRSYTTVLDRFTGQLSATDPLQTLFQLLSGRIPAVATWCGGPNRVDWRPHLAVMLSNETGDSTLRQRAVVTMGDTLASRGLVHAAHVCYLMSGVPFGAFTETTARMVLLGCSHKDTFRRFASNAAIRCTEIYEFCQTLGAKHFSIPSFQVFKFLYAARLLDCGLACQALHYCEVIGRTLLVQPEVFHVLTEELIKLAERLTHAEGPFSAVGSSGTGQEPSWLTALRARHHGFLKGSDRADIQQAVPQAEEHNNKFSEPDITGSQSPETEPLHGNRTMDGHTLGQQLSCNVGGTQEWTEAQPPMPRVTAHAYPASSAAVWDQNIEQNTAGAEVGSVSPRESGWPVAAQCAVLPSGVAPGRNQVSESSHTKQLSSQSTRSGWFRGWFRSKSPDRK